MNSESKPSTASPESNAAGFVSGFKSHRQALMQHFKTEGAHAHNRIPQHDDVSSDSETPFALTRYMKMLLQLNEIPTLQNFLAGFFTWIVLAGYMVFPATFTSLRHSKTVNDAADDGKAGQHAVDVVQNVPLLWLAAICCISGTSGMCWLWWKWQENYVWLINRIFLFNIRPGLLHSVAGLITTLVNVYSAQGGNWSVTATITAVVTGVFTGTMLALFLLYNNWLLADVKKSHEQELSGEHDGLLRP